jgi:hypothetical protein
LQLTYCSVYFLAERVIEFEQDEESEEEPEPMETDQPNTEIVESQTSLVTEQLNNEPVVTTTTETTSTSIQPSTGATTVTTTTTTESTSAHSASIATTKTSENSIPGGPSSLLNNKAISSIQQEEEMEDDESRSQTPKLDDISDEEPDPTLDNDDDDNDTDNMNDPSKHPALAPHAQAHMTDDDMMTDSTAATPQTEETTPMPQLDDEDMEEQSTTNAPAHPLSQEILTGIMAQDDIASLNNDSPAIQTPEDISSVSHPHNPMGDN